MNVTKSKILDSAERLIAEHGLDVSLRTITADAGVNLAAVNYHFQSKDALWDAVVARRFEPINTRRLQMLEAIEAEHPTGTLPLERVLEAFLGPPFEFSGQCEEHFRPLMGRLYTLPEEHLKRVFGEHIKPIVERFAPAFQRAVPGLTEDACRWRMVFSIGALVNLMNWTRVIPIVSSGRLDPRDPKEVMTQIIAYSAAGFRAMETNEEGAES